MKTTTALLLLLLLAGRLAALALNATCVCTADEHSCLVSGVGDAVCWGYGNSGRLGYGTTTQYLSPAAALAANPGGVQVTQTGGVAVLKIVCGGSFTMALLANGEARGFGWNSHGQLGLGHTQNVGDNELPWEPPGGPVTLSGPARDVCSGSVHCCGVMSAPNLGKVACWGDAENGRLGYGNTNHVGDGETVASAGFVDVDGSGNVTAIFCGSYHTLALMSDSTLRAWGSNEYGQLGLGHTNDIGDDELPSSQPNIAGLGGATIDGVSTGEYHSCVVSSVGLGKCFGHGRYGRLGTGDTSNVLDPSSVGFLDLQGELLVQLEAFNVHTCGVLVTGDVKCFGSSSEGRLGCGWACADRLAPNERMTLSGPVVRLAVGSRAFHTLAVHPDGSFQAWGLNHWGQLGYGDTANVGDDETPASVGNVNFPDGVICAAPLPNTLTATGASKTQASHTATTASKTVSELSDTATQPSATLATHSRTGITRTPHSRPATLTVTVTLASATEELQPPPRSSLAVSSTSAGATSVLVFVLLGVGVLALLVVLCLTLLFVVRRRRGLGSNGDDSGGVEMVGVGRVESAVLTTPAEEGRETQYTAMPTFVSSEYAQLPDKHKQALIAVGHVVDFAELELGEKVGEGQFGVVYRGVWRRAPVAVKELKSFDPKLVAEFEREAELHKRLPAHANVVQFLAVASGERMCLVVEFVAGGSLERRGRLAGAELLGIARGIAAGMAHLHAHEVIHRDLAARNVLLSAEGVPKVTDFGMSRLVVTGEYVTQSNVLPLKWLAPETVQTHAFTKASDVWSYGVLLFEVVEGHAPWPELSGFEVSRRVGHEGAVPEVHADTPVAAVMRACFERDPQRRPSFAHVVGIL